MTRILRLASPYMRGTDVTAAQKRLIAAGYLSKTQNDGIYGPVTANAAKRAKWALGFKAADLQPVYASVLDDYLAGKRKPSAAMRLRGKRRREQAKRRATIGAKAADRMVRWYQAGWKELPAGSNKVPALQQLCKKLGLSSYYTNMGYPWCALAVFTAALAEGSVAAKNGLRLGKFNALYTPEIQSVAARGSLGLSAVSTSSIRKGVAVLMDFNGGGVDHIGIALGSVGESVAAGGRRWQAGPGEVVCVEANTSYDNNGSQANGGCVAIRVRPVGIIRTPFVIT